MSRIAALVVLLLLIAVAALWWFPQEAPSSRTAPSSTTVESGTRESAADLAAAPPPEQQDLARTTAPASPSGETAGAEEGEPPLATVRVQVVNPDGKARTSVPVLLQRTEPWGAMTLDQETSDKQGYLTLTDAPRFGASAEARPVTIGFPFPVRGASKPLEFQSDSWPQETVVLTIPATGMVEVHLLGLDGHPWSRPAEVHLAPVTLFAKKGKPIRAEGISNTGVEAKDGVALFPAVGLGMKLEIGILYDSWADWKVVRVSGPKEAGQSIRVDLQAEAEAAVWSMRLLDSAGTPLANRQVAGTRRSWSADTTSIRSSARWLGSYLTDEKGRLAFPAVDAFEADVSELQLLVDSTADAVTAYGTLPVLNSHSQTTTDFGEQRLQLSERLVSGQVLSPAGVPVHATISLTAPEVAPIGQDIGLAAEYAAIPDSRSTDLGEGRFEAFGISEENVLRLKVSATGFLPQELDVNKGSSGIRIVLAPDLGIPGRLVVPEGFAAKEFRIIYRAGIKPPSEADWWENQQEATPDAQGNFRISELKEAAPGFLAVFHRDSALKILQVEQVVPIASEELVDPRLDPLTLPELFRFQVKAGGPGDDSPMLQWGILDPPGMADRGFGYTWGGNFDFVLLRPQAKIGILADGFRYQEVTVVPGENQISLKRAPLVQFQATELPQLPDGLRYSISLDSLDGPDMLDLTTSLPEGIGGGVFPAPMPASGRFTVRLKVRNRETGVDAEVLDGTEPWAFTFEIAEEAAGQLIDIPIPVEGILDAIQKALPPKD